MPGRRPVSRVFHRHLPIGRIDVGDPPPCPPRKEDAPCCMARTDAEGRLPVGFCSPGCVRRPSVWEAKQALEPVDRLPTRRL